MADQHNDDQDNSQEENPDLRDDGVAQEPEAEAELGGVGQEPEAELSNPDSDQTESKTHTDPYATEDSSSVNPNPYILQDLKNASSSRNSQSSVNREEDEIEETTSETESIIQESFYGTVTHVVVESQGAHKPLIIGSILYDTVKRVPLGRVESITGPETQPTSYTVRLDPQNETVVGTSSLVEDTSDEEEGEEVMQIESGEGSESESEGSGLAAVPPQQRSLILRLSQHLNVPDDDQVVPTMTQRQRPPRLTPYQREYSWIHQMELARQREMPERNQNRLQGDDHVVPQPSAVDQTSVNQQQNIGLTNAPPGNPNPDQQTHSQEQGGRGPEDED